MKKFFKYCLFVLPALALVFIIVLSCNKENMLKDKDINPVFTYSGWDYDTWYDYRSAHPDYLGDSSFLLRVYYNSMFQVVRVDLSIVEAEPDDSIRSFLFVDYDIDECDDSLYFEIPEDDKVWVIDLVEYAINVPYNPNPGTTTILCNCIPSSGSICHVRYLADGVSANCVSHNCSCYECWCALYLNGQGFNDPVKGPHAIIRADKLRFNGVLYQ